MRNVALPRLALTIGIALMALAASCRSPLSSLAEPTGSLTIVLPASASYRGAPAASSRGLADHAGTIATWRLEGTGPEGKTYAQDFTAAEVIASEHKVTIELALGAWTMTIRGLDGDGTETFTAIQEVSLRAAEPATCAMTLQWAEKALVARLSFDEGIKDDKGRVTTSPSDTDTWIPTASTVSVPSLDSEKYLSFSGSEYIDLSPQELGEDISVSLWVGPNATTDQGVIMTNQEGEQVNTPGFSIALYASTSPCIGLYYLDGVTATAIDEAQYIPGRWNHITVTLDNINRSISLFVNGTKIATNALSSKIPINQAIRIGNNKIGSESFTGSLDDVRIYSGTLSTEEIADIYADGFFSGGRGTAEAPYLVATPMDLYNVRYFTSASFCQTMDIDLNENEMTKSWKPIPSLKGSYAGGNKTISNLNLSDGIAYVGLFEELSTDGKVVDLRIDGASGDDLKKTAGALAGNMIGATVENVSLANITLTTTTTSMNLGGLIGRIDNTSASTIRTITLDTVTITGRTLVGGLVGYVDKKADQLITIDGVNASKLNILAALIRAGGLIGQTAEPTIIKNAVIAGKVTSTSATPEYIGGLIGYLVGATVDNCRADVIVGEGNSFTGSRELGGFAGQLEGPSTLTNCHAIGAVHGNNSGSFDANAGGFAGYIVASNLKPVSLANCTASGSVNVPTGKKVGGFVGYIQNQSTSEVITLGDCSASGNVIVNSGINIGGFAGMITGKPDLLTLTRCTSSGTTTNNGGENTGGFAGSIETYAKVERCSASGAVTANAVNAGGFVGMSTSNAIINQCRAEGSATGTTVVGGFVGYAATSTISQCFSLGLATGTGNNLGGFAGHFVSGTIANCYSRGGVTGTGGSNRGGFIGYIAASGCSLDACYSTGPLNNFDFAFIGGPSTALVTTVIANCYWDLASTYSGGELVNSDYITEPKFTKLYSILSLSGWTPVWTFSTGSYPTLAWEHETP